MSASFPRPSDCLLYGASAEDSEHYGVPYNWLPSQKHKGVFGQEDPCEVFWFPWTLLWMNGRLGARLALVRRGDLYTAVFTAPQVRSLGIPLRDGKVRWEALGRPLTGFAPCRFTAGWHDKVPQVETRWDHPFIPMESLRSDLFEPNTNSALTVTNGGVQVDLEVSWLQWRSGWRPAVNIRGIGEAGGGQYGLRMFGFQSDAQDTACWWVAGSFATRGGTAKTVYDGIVGELAARNSDAQYRAGRPFPQVDVPSAATPLALGVVDGTHPRAIWAEACADAAQFVHLRVQDRRVPPVEEGRGFTLRWRPELIRPYVSGELELTPPANPTEDFLPTATLSASAVPRTPGELRDCRLTVEHWGSLRVLAEAPARRNMTELARFRATTLESHVVERAGPPGAQRLKFVLNYDSGGLATGRVEAEDPQEQRTIHTFSSEPFFIASLEGEPTPGGIVLAEWPRPDSRTGWRFYDSDGVTRVRLQAASLAEPFSDRADDDDPAGEIDGRRIQVRLSTPIVFNIDQTEVEGETMAEPISNPSRIFGGQGSRPYGPLLKTLDIEPMAGVAVAVDSSDRQLRLSELSGVVGDLAVLDPTERESWADNTERTHRRLLRRAAMLVPWRDDPRMTAPLMGRARVEPELLAQLLSGPPDAHSWADVSFAVPPLFRRLLRVDGNASITDLALTSLGATGRFSMSFEERVKIDVTLDVGRVMRYRVEIPGHLSCVGNLASYIAIYERQLFDVPQPPPKSSPEEFAASPIAIRRGRVALKDRFIKVTQTCRRQGASGIETFVAEDRYEISSTVGDEKTFGTFWILDNISTKGASNPRGRVECISPSEASNESTRPGQEKARPALVTAACSVEQLSFKACFDPKAPASPDAWPPLAGYDFHHESAPTKSVPLLRIADAPGLQVDIGYAQNVLLPVPLSGLAVELVRGTSRDATTVAAPEVLQHVLQEWNRVASKLEYLPSNGHSSDLLWSILRAGPERAAEVLRDAPPPVSLDWLALADRAVLVDEKVRHLATAARAAAKASSKAAVDLLREAAIGAAAQGYTALKERLSAIAAPIADTDEQVRRWWRDVELALTLPWTVPGERLLQFAQRPNATVDDVRAELDELRRLNLSPSAQSTIDKWIHDVADDLSGVCSDIRGELEPLAEHLVPWMGKSIDELVDFGALSGPIEGVTAMLRTLFAPIALKMEATTPALAEPTPAGGEPLATAFEHLAGANVRALVSVATAREISVGALLRELTAELGRVPVPTALVGSLSEITRIREVVVGAAPSLLGLAGSAVGGKRIELAEVGKAAWKDAELAWPVGRIDGAEIAKAAGASFDKANPMEGALELVRLEAGKVVAEIANGFAALPFKNPMPKTVLGLTPSFDPTTKQVTMTGSGSSEPTNMVLVDDLLSIDGAIADYSAEAVATTQGNLRLRLKAGVRGTLNVLPGSPEIGIKIPDFGISADERGNIDLQLDPAKIQLPGLMKKLNEALAGATGGKCSIEQTGAGVRARFQHDVPSIGSPGSAQMMNLSLGAALTLEREGDDRRVSSAPLCGRVLRSRRCRLVRAGAQRSQPHPKADSHSHPRHRPGRRGGG
jgi:hypothetical protein